MALGSEGDVFGFAANFSSGSSFEAGDAIAGGEGVTLRGDGTEGSIVAEFGEAGGLVELNLIRPSHTPVNARNRATIIVG